MYRGFGKEVLTVESRWREHRFDDIRVRRQTVPTTSRVVPGGASPPSGSEPSDGCEHRTWDQRTEGAPCDGPSGSSRGCDKRTVQEGVVVNQTQLAKRDQIAD